MRRRISFFTVWCACLVLGSLWITVSSAQDYRAKVQGVVTDSSQAVVPGATITLGNDNTGVETTKTSNENGHYVFDFVDPGTYTVTVEMPGFTKFVQKNVHVQVRGDVTVNAVLNIGAVAETVEVQATTSTLQMNTSTMEMTIDRKMLMDLPVKARNPFTLALLDPGRREPLLRRAQSVLHVVVDPDGCRRKHHAARTICCWMARRFRSAPRVRTRRRWTRCRSSRCSRTRSMPSSATPRAAPMSVSMKSGTNEIHGTAYYFGRNPALNAVVNPITRTPNFVRNHIWGGTVGAPIKKNKLFNFFTYEGWRTKEPRDALRTHADRSRAHRRLLADP